MSGTLVRTITPAQAVALYVGAVIGAGVLILPGAAATVAGPASVVAWAGVSLLGVPLALTFAALAARYPDAGGVATFSALALGPSWGAAVGWFYFLAGATGQIIVPLTGAYYAAGPLGLGRGGTSLLAAGILGAVVAANLRGLRLSGRLQLALSSGVVGLLLTATLAALPRMRPEHWEPFAPHGWGAVGQAGVLVFFAVFGWEAIAQLSAEFRDPARDVPRSTLWSVGLITLLYVGVAAATIGTGTYGTPEVDRVAVARLLADASGVGAGLVAAGMALLICLGTANAYVAATSRLGYALARDGSFPVCLARLDRRGVPVVSVGAVGAYASIGLALAYAVGWGPERLLIIPNSLGIATYVVGTAAGVRLLGGRHRWLAGLSLVLCLTIFPFAGAALALPLAVAPAAWLYRRLFGRSGPQRG
jgi:amino acid efflux transporter